MFSSSYANGIGGSNTKNREGYASHLIDIPSRKSQRMIDHGSSWTWRVGYVPRGPGKAEPVRHAKMKSDAIEVM